MQNPARRRTIICLVMVVFGVWKFVTEVSKEPLMEMVHGQDEPVRVCLGRIDFNTFSRIREGTSDTKRPSQVKKLGPGLNTEEDLGNISS